MDHNHRAYVAVLECLVIVLLRRQSAAVEDWNALVDEVQRDAVKCVEDSEPVPPGDYRAAMQTTLSRLRVRGLLEAA